MKRSSQFALSTGNVTCPVPGGGSVLLPVIPGILKHPMPSQLFTLLADVRVARKYTRLALEKASWPVLRQFPPAWLEACLESADLRPGRKQALLYLLS